MVRCWFGVVFAREIGICLVAARRYDFLMPEDIAHSLELKWKDLPRVALESLAIEAYRSQALSAAQLRRLLGFATRMQVDEFLKEHKIYEFTLADFEHDREALRQLTEKEASQP